MAGERSLSDVLRDIARNIQDIVRSELRLAKTEVREELANAQSAGVLLAIGFGGSLLAAFFLLLSIVYALSLVMPSWAAALCVGGARTVFAAVVFKFGGQRVKNIRVIPKGSASVKENLEWAKQQTK